MTELLATAKRSDPSQTVDYFNALAASWTARYVQSPHFHARLDTVLAWLVDARPGLELLDYGCGSGVLLHPLARTGHRVTGTDVSEGMLEEARKNVQAVSNGGSVRLVKVDEQFEGRYTDRFYDGIILLGVLEYLDRNDPGTLLKRLFQQLRPGGFLIVSVPNSRSWLRQAEGWVYRHSACFRALRLFSHLTGPDCYLKFQKHQWTTRELKQLVGEKDYQLLQVRYHVAPTLFAAVENHERIGMTVIGKFIKMGSTEAE
jgi:2-polyprenyl-3-methyl-5-hydroxy-6-metoxy-1,4-benzoquinol methylase